MAHARQLVGGSMLKVQEDTMTQTELERHQLDGRARLGYLRAANELNASSCYYLYAKQLDTSKYSTHVLKCSYRRRQQPAQFKIPTGQLELRAIKFS